MRLALSRWWVQGAIYAVVLGTVMTVLELSETHRWVPALVGGSVSALLFGTLMGLIMSRMNTRLLGGLAALAPADRKTVARAARRGTVPSDPRLRAAARDTLVRLQDQTVRSRRTGAVVFSVLVVLAACLAVAESAWWWLLAVGGAVLLALCLVMPGRYRRRVIEFDRQAEAAERGAV